MKIAVVIFLTFSIASAYGCVNQSKKTTLMSENNLANSNTIITEPIKFSFVLPRTQNNFPAYLIALKNYALQKGIDKNVVEKAFTYIYFASDVIKADRNQPEKKFTLAEYIQKVLPKWKIDEAKQKYQQFHAKLSPVSQQYGVPEEYIVALWGIESNFGKIQGKKNILASMATLAFEGRREVFFLNEFISALKIIQYHRVPYDQLVGSWAGAMGQCQFMPSSYLKYGVDGNHNGYIDIWNNLHDVFASIANYLAVEGWQTNLSWGEEVTLPSNFNMDWVGLSDNQKRSVKEWQRLGIHSVQANKLPANLQTWLVIPDNYQEGRAFLVSSNFKTLMKWNRSYYFAVSVGLLADSIKQ